MPILKAYILTREENQYDQHGEYFVAWFQHKPADWMVKKTILEDSGDALHPDYLAHVMAGGGRMNKEDTWWFLREVPSFN